MREALCPECGDPLSVEVEEDEETGNINIILFCEGAGEDEYELKIDTNLWNDDLIEWKKIGSTKKAIMTLINRKPDPLYKLDPETGEIVERDSE